MSSRRSCSVCMISSKFSHPTGCPGPEVPMLSIFLEKGEETGLEARVGGRTDMAPAKVNHYNDNGLGSNSGGTYDLKKTKGVSGQGGSALHASRPSCSLYLAGNRTGCSGSGKSDA